MNETASRNLKRGALAILAVAMAAPALAAAPAWPQFRGPNCSGVSEIDQPPVHFNANTNFLWKSALPRGVSSPSIYGDYVLLTGVEGKKLETICLRRRDGAILWRRSTPAERIEDANPSSSPASATPATDGERVYVYFGSYGLLAYDFEGREAWRRPLPIPTVADGSGASPALMEGRLLLNLDQELGKSSLLAVEASTGRVLWQTPRPDCFSSYPTPILWKRGSIREVVLAGSYRVAGYDLEDGQERWFARGTEAFSVCPTPVLGADQLYVMSYSFGGSKPMTFAEICAQLDKDKNELLSRDEARPGLFDLLDKNKDDFISAREWDANTEMLTKGEHGVFAIRPPGTGDVTGSHLVWKQKKGAATVASPLFYRDRLYTVQDGGRVTCFEARTGRILYEQERLGAEGAYHASPVAAGGRIYFASARGAVTVIEAGDDLKVLAQSELGESISATPAIADHKIYIRTANHLWAFGSERSK